jgi:hypothetical protein
MLTSILCGAAGAEEAATIDAPEVVARSAPAVSPSRAPAASPSRTPAAPPSRAPADPLRLRLVWMDLTGSAIGSDVVARSEAKALLERMGLEVSWRRGGAREEARPGEVRVILLDRAARRPSGPPILGATPASFEVMPYVWIHVPSVRAALGIPPRSPVSGLDAWSRHGLGISLGRVVAHEIVHALAPWVPHGTGLMSAELRRRDLLGGRIAIEPEVALAVQAALRGEAGRPERDAGLLAAEGRR